MKKLVSVFVLFFVIQINAQKNVVQSLNLKKNKLLFKDNFERVEGLGAWSVAEKFDGAFKTSKGVWITKEIEGAGHGSTARIQLDYKDVIIEFDFQFQGGKRFNIVMDDSTCKSVWAGHICRASFSKGGFMVQDDKTGSMDLNIRNQIKDNPEKKKEFKSLLDSKRSFVKTPFKDGQWYHVKITKKNDVLECCVNDKVARIKSEGIDHVALNKFGPTITGAQIWFKNLSIWSVK